MYFNLNIIVAIKFISLFFSKQNFSVEMLLRVGYNYVFSVINNAELLCTMHFSFGWTLDVLLLF